MAALKGEQRYELLIHLTEPLLGAVPLNRDVYDEVFLNRRPAEKAEGVPLHDDLEGTDVPDIGDRGHTGFHTDDTGLYLYDYVVKGFLTEACRAVKPPRGVQAAVTQRLFVVPRKLYLHQPNGPVYQAPVETFSRSLRAMTPQGPRVSVIKSDVVPAGTVLHCQVVVLASAREVLSEGQLRELLDYGKWKGLGQFRSGSFGRFEYKLNA